MCADAVIVLCIASARLVLFVVNKLMVALIFNVAVVVAMIMWCVVPGAGWLDTGLGVVPQLSTDRLFDGSSDKTNLLDVSGVRVDEVRNELGMQVTPKPR